MNKFLLIIASFFFSGCASAHAAKHVETAPVVRSHPITVKVWVGGQWVHRGHHRHWTRGHWVMRPAPRRPHPHSAWVPGHYNHHGAWTPGYWR